jgi:hypothetical protein
MVKPAGSGASIAKLQAGICRGQKMESTGNTRYQDFSRRPALMILRIVSRSLFDVPVNKVGPVFPRADRKRMLNRPREPFA